MFRLTVVLIGLIAICNAEESSEKKPTKKTNLTPIEHVIVLMLENRSFDHMLGFLKTLVPDLEGCVPDAKGCSNPTDLSDPTSAAVTVDDTAVYSQVSPSHSIAGTTEQIYPASSTEPTMQGFIASYAGKTTNGADIMKCFSPDHLPVMSNLTREFTIIDGWHAGVPGPTMPNRAYAISATSAGMGTNDEKTIAIGMSQKSLFRQLQEMGLDYRVYFQSVPTTLMLKDMRHRDARPKYSAYNKFAEDAKAGNLPEYTWIEPNYFNVDSYMATDQHPDHDVSLGETLIKQVYDAIRQSPLWEKSALLVTYDEHGGFFDHVPPPTNVPNPDGINSTDDPFDFTRLGVRVPMLLISPWAEKGRIIHAKPAGEGQYEHSSLAATIAHKLFAPVHGQEQPYLTKRDAWAATFESAFTTLTSPRTDCPALAPDAPSHRALSPSSFTKKFDGSGLLNDLQMDLLKVVAGTTEDGTFDSSKLDQWTEKEAVQYAQTRLNSFFERDIVQMV